MIDNGIRNKIRTLFGLPLLEARRYERLNEEQDDLEWAVDVSLIWIAELRERRYRVSGRNLIVAVVKAEEWKKGKWRKGILLLPSDRSITGEDYIEEATLKPIDLLKDPVEELLRNFDLISSNHHEGLVENTMSFSISVIGETMSTEVSVRNAARSENPNIHSLYRATIEVVVSLRNSYNKEEINRFFDH